MGGKFAKELGAARDAAAIEALAARLDRYVPTLLERERALANAVDSGSETATRAFAASARGETPRLDYRIALSAVEHARPSAAAALAVVFSTVDLYGKQIDAGPTDIIVVDTIRCVAQIVSAALDSDETDRLFATIALACVGGGYRPLLEAVGTPLRYYAIRSRARINHATLIALLGFRPSDWDCECCWCAVMAARPVPLAGACLADHYATLNAVCLDGTRDADRRYERSLRVMDAAYAAYDTRRGQNTIAAPAPTLAGAPAPVAPEVVPTPEVADLLAGDGSGPAGACAVCFETRPLALCEPCYHFAACFPCARELRAAGAPCVVCRGPVTWRRTFVA